MKTRLHTTLSDEELFQTWTVTKDTEWLGHLLQRYSLLLLGVAMKYLKDKDLAQDAVQQVFLKTLTYLPGAAPVQNFKGWIYVMMRNYCFQYLRDRHQVLGEEALVNTADVTDKEDYTEYTLGDINAAVLSLNDDQRTAIRFFYIEKLSYQQIMERTGCTFMQVKSNIQNGKRKLKLLLSKKAHDK
ncbi:MAG: sigma-70 family RNA polymerase sigma factor [Taibaiella sp.]|nr:sigma-70 family RNA polymerase sigma factor [Taibaiella sp.]